MHLVDLAAEEQDLLYHQELQELLILEAEAEEEAILTQVIRMVEMAEAE
jgi:hypothetical protein